MENGGKNSMENGDQNSIENEQEWCEKWGQEWYENGQEITRNGMKNVGWMLIRNMGEYRTKKWGKSGTKSGTKMPIIFVPA